MNSEKRVFVAGATGVIGRAVCTLLVADGWHVTGTTRRAEAAHELETVGVEPAVVDMFHADALRTAVLNARPTAVIHQLTDLPKRLDPMNLKEALMRNALLREVGTKNLIDACIACGVGHVVAQSIAFAYAPGPQPFTEDAPLNVHASDPVAARTASAVRILESLVLAGPFRGVVLRYGKLYGPGTWAATPPIGAPLHVDAAADAARRALLHGETGVYNVAEPDGMVSIVKVVHQLGWSPDFRIRRAGEQVVRLPD
ncbi:MAG: NAD(P)-dependent oxidoreductase [Acidobacteria bacterium]|nr:NAD(P)-dependent oxidoreductase [Acidobacteriota bacterium]